MAAQNGNKAKYDLGSHLNEIPLLGKQYVPKLWNTIDPEQQKYQMPVEVQKQIYVNINLPSTSTCQQVYESFGFRKSESMDTSPPIPQNDATIDTKQHNDMKRAFTDCPTLNATNRPIKIARLY